MVKSLNQNTKRKKQKGTNAFALHRMSVRSYRNQQTAAMMRATVPKMMNADIMTTHTQSRAVK